MKRNYKIELKNLLRVICLLIKKFRLTENKVVELNNQVMHIKNELEDSQKQIARNQQNEKSLRDELEHAKIQFMDMQRAERVARIDLGQIRATVRRLKLKNK